MAAAPDFDVGDKEANPGPASPLEVYLRAIEPSADDDFLEHVNLGLGHYSNREYWMQIKSFEHGLYGEAAFARLIVQRAKHEAMVGLARDIWTAIKRNETGPRSWLRDRSFLDGIDADETNEEAFIHEFMGQIWDNLGHSDSETIPKPTHARLHMIEKYSGIDRNWVPPHWRMLQARHEASRSRGARLMDNLFGSRGMSAEEAAGDVNGQLGGFS